MNIPNFEFVVLLIWEVDNGSYLKFKMIALGASLQKTKTHRIADGVQLEAGTRLVISVKRDISLSLCRTIPPILHYAPSDHSHVYERRDDRLLFRWGTGHLNRIPFVEKLNLCMVHLSIIGCVKLSLQVRGSQEAGFTQLHGDKFTLLITLRFKIFCPNLPVLVLPSISHRVKRPPPPLH